MQDMHAIGDGGGGARIAGVGDRRLRPHNQLSHQALKCPRCDSLNTKFCYYNNYNLSQPRHFCKSCHRYWTKGGLLRNVPVGGGCRKTKCYKAKGSTSDALRESESNAQSSSSDSSSLTAANASTATPPSAVAEEGSAPSNTTTSNSTVVYNFRDRSLSDVNPQSIPNNFDNQPLVINNSRTDGQIFAMEMGIFTSLITPSEMMGLGMVDVPTTSYRNKPVSQAPLAATVDWGSGDQGMFDLTAVGDPADWNESIWTDNDQSLNNWLP